MRKRSVLKRAWAVAGLKVRELTTAGRWRRLGSASRDVVNRSCAQGVAVPGRAMTRMRRPAGGVSRATCREARDADPPGRRRLRPPGTSRAGGTDRACTASVIVNRRRTRSGSPYIATAQVGTRHANSRGASARNRIGGRSGRRQGSAPTQLEEGDVVAAVSPRRCPGAAGRPGSPVLSASRAAGGPEGPVNVGRVLLVGVGDTMVAYTRHQTRQHPPNGVRRTGDRLRGSSHARSRARRPRSGADPARLVPVEDQTGGRRDAPSRQVRWARKPPRS